MIDSLFVHIPKTGGTSVKRIFRDPRFNSQTTFSKHYISWILKRWKKENIKSCYLFTFMRNPYTRVISAYEFRFRTWEDNIREGASNSFEEYGKNMSFKSYIDVITRTEFDISLRFYSPQLLAGLPPQINWILNSQGEVGVDYIGRTETLEKDVKIIANNIGVFDVDDIYIPHGNPSTWRHENYKDYYDDESRKKVAQYFERDIDFLKVKF
jgi:hypothetical protein